MNYIAATVDIVAHSEELVTTYGEHAQASAVIPGNGPQASVKLRLLCHNGGSAKLAAFKNLKTGTRAFITGNIFFAHKDTSSPLDVIVVTLEPTVPQSMYCNQVVLGNAFFTAGKDEIKEQKSGNCAVNIATSLDNSDDVTYLKMEIANPAVNPSWSHASVRGVSFAFRDTSASFVMATFSTVRSLRLTSPTVRTLKAESNLSAQVLQLVTPNRIPFLRRTLVD